MRSAPPPPGGTVRRPADPTRVARHCVLDHIFAITDHTRADCQLVVDRVGIIVDSRNATKQIQRHRERIVRA